MGHVKVMKVDKLKIYTSSFLLGNELKADTISDAE